MCASTESVSIVENTDGSAQQTHYSGRHKGDGSDYSISHTTKVKGHRNQPYTLQDENVSLEDTVLFQIYA